MLKSFQPKLFLQITLAFIVFTVIGTLTHELGHISAAKYIGAYEVRLHYGSMNSFDSTTIKYRRLLRKYQNSIHSNQDFPEKAEFEKLKKEHFHNAFIVTLGGPLQTIVTGSLAFCCLFFYGKRFKTDNSVNWKGWILVFLSLFWLRQVANFTIGLAKYFLNGFNWNSCSTDECDLADSLHLPIYSIALATDIIGSLVLYWILKYYLPKNIKHTFVLGGLFGGVLGYLLWLEWLGRYILP